MGGSDYRPGFDERREVWRLLGHLDARARRAFLDSLCASVSTEGVKTVVTESDDSVSDAYWLIQTLCFDRGMNLEAVGEKLVRWVRRFGRATRPCP